MQERWDEVLTPKDVIEITKISRTKVYELMRSGDIQSFYLGKRNIRTTSLALGSWEKLGKSKWRGRIDVPAANGKKRKQASKTFYGKEELVHEQFRDWVKDVRSRSPISVGSQICSLMACWLEDLNDRVESGVLKKNTRESYYYASVRIKEVLGKIDAYKLSLDDVENFVKGLNKEEIGPTYVHYHIKVLSIMLHFAVARKYISHNVLKDIRKNIRNLPKLEKNKPKIIEFEPYTRILANSTNKTMTQMIRFAHGTGIRRGELLSLQ